MHSPPPPPHESLISQQVLTEEEDTQAQRNVNDSDDDGTTRMSINDSGSTRESAICMIGSGEKSSAFPNPNPNCSNKSEKLPSSSWGHKKEEDIYGAASGGGISFIGSWALRSCLDEVAANMSSKPEGQTGRGRVEEGDALSSVGLIGNGNGGGGVGSQRDSGEQGYQPWRFEAGTTFQIRVSHLFKLFLVWVVVMGIATLLFHTRIRELEGERHELRGEVVFLTSRVNMLIQKMDDVVSLIPPKSSYRAELSRDDDGDEDELEESNDRVRRNAGPVPRRATKNLQYSRGDSSMTHNSLNNETNSPFDSMMDASWSTRVTPTTGAGIDQQSMKGKNINKHRVRKLARKKLIRRMVRRELDQFQTANRLQLASLTQTVSQLQQQLLLHNLSSSCCSNDNDSSSDYDLALSSNDLLQAVWRQKSPRAAYLQLDVVSVHIKKPRLELIGPWYLSNSGEDIGFGGGNDIWYDNLALDSNGTAVVFQEDGLFLIYAQVFYQLQQVHNSNPTPMGYRIHLRKSGSGGGWKSGRKPITIAECVPSFPTTIYQTCFTQVVWSVQAQDELYLEHFTDSRPIIEAVSNGQTFLGVVRLSN